MSSNNTFSFLQGGGEMGELTRRYNWNDSELGDPLQWPQSLRTTLSIILNSKFPMFLFWGKDLICFYNDAYRPSLGNEGKHPWALGKKGIDVWPEIWADIKPIIDNVLAGGEANWSEDQLLPIYRNGKLEDVYWTFSYSPVNDESGKPAGVFVTCSETTNKVKTLQQLKLAEDQFQKLILQAPIGICVIDAATLVAEIANERFVELAGKPYNTIVGHYYWDAFAEIKPYFEDALKSVIDGGPTYYANEAALMLVRRGQEENIYATLVYDPIKDEAGRVKKIVVWMVDNTERVTVRKKIEESELNLRNTILQSPVATCILQGPNHVIEIANERMIELWGAIGRNVIGKPVFVALPEVKNQGFEALLDKVYYTGETHKAFGISLQLLREGKMQTVYIDFVYEPFRDEDGRISGVLAVAIDVTTQIIARKSIEAAEEKVRLAVLSANLGTYEIDLTTDVITASHRFIQLWGLEHSVSRTQFVAAIHPDDQAAREAANKQVTETGSLHYEARVIWPDRSQHWVSITGKILYDINGQPVTLLGVAQDISEQKIFAEELKKQVSQRTQELEWAQTLLQQGNRYLQSIINKFESAIVSLVPIYAGEKIVDFYYKMTNTAYSVYSKLSPEEIQNKKLGDVFPSYFQTEAFTRYVETFETGKYHDWELHYNRDNLNVYLQMTASKMGEEVIVNFTDISELKNLQLDLERKVQELERSNEELQQFAHVASHDLKEPVRKIRTFSSRLKTEYQETLSGKANQFLDKIESAAARIYTMIDGVLLYSSINTVHEKPTIVDLNETIQQIEEDLEVLIQEKGATIHCEELPSVEGAPILLYQLFYNLLNNSLKFTKAGVPPLIQISSKLVSASASEEENTYAIIRLEDNGIGFNQKFADTIFKTFMRLHAKDEYEGTGLGLALCQKIVVQHGGSIQASGEVGQGAVFTVRLPLKQSGRR